MLPNDTVEDDMAERTCPNCGEDIEDALGAFQYDGVSFCSEGCAAEYQGDDDGDEEEFEDDDFDDDDDEDDEDDEDEESEEEFDEEFEEE
jgi:hypothetical protein